MRGSEAPGEQGRIFSLSVFCPLSFSPFAPPFFAAPVRD